MAQKRSRAADYAVYLVVRIMVCIVQTLSWDKALTLARGLAWLAYRIDRRHRLVAIDNLRHASPQLDAAAIDRLARASYLHFATMVVEMMRLPRVLRRANIYAYVRHAHPDDLPHLLRLANSGRPKLVLTGHFGNWELLSYVTGVYGLRGGIVARRLDNPYLDRYLAAFRSQVGLTLLDKNADYPRILEIMTQGGGLGMVADQDAGPRGLFVTFFGRPASTFKSIGLLSLEYGAPIIVVGVARISQPMQYRFYFEDVIYPEDYAARADACRAITQRYTDALERLVRRHPEQYFWVHRRWKHQPQAKKAA
jgi:KDO2-lipid IV(A) lauroyltransferase